LSSSSPLAWDATVPGLPLGAAARLDALEPLYAEWNAAINVISRKDFGHFVEHHVLHSLAVFRAVPFAPGSRIQQDEKSLLLRGAAADEGEAALQQAPARHTGDLTSARPSSPTVRGPDLDPSW
jgi:hypothetical protein